MQQKIWGRVLIIVAVVVVSLYYLIPSARLIAFKLTTDVPPTTNKVAYEKYEARLRQLETWTLPFGAAPVRFGLDLQGGTDVTLELDRPSAIRDQLSLLERQIKNALSAQDIDATFNSLPLEEALQVSVLRAQDVRAANLILEKNFSDIFGNWDQQAFEKTQRVTLKLDNAYVTNQVIANAMEGARKVIGRRVDALGLVQPVVVKAGEDRIRVQMPGARDPERVVRTIIQPAQLEFRLLHKDNNGLIAKLFAADELKRIAAHIEKNKVLPPDMKFQAGAEVPTGYVLVPGELSSDAEAGARRTQYAPFVVRDRVELTGGSLRNAYAYMNPSNLRSPYEIHMEFDRQGAITFGEITEQNVNEKLAIILDSYLYSAPNINEPIRGGRAQITGDFTNQEAVDLALVLKAGALPASFNVIDQRVVEATLGVDSIRKGILSLMVGVLAVIVFLMIYYGTSGAIATVALFVNMFIVAAVVAISRATLTLSGIAGVLLTVGMADDANVLINERIREERSTSKGLKTAIAKGFSRAFSVIFDSNLTTLITALVLLQFGTGSVQGFALTLTFGIFATLFSGLFVTHALTDLWVQMRNQLNIGTLTLFKNPKFDFVRIRYYGYAFSLSMLVLGATGIAMNGGVQWGVEFTGGVRADVTFTQPTSEDQIKAALGRAGFESPVVQRVRGENRYIVRVKAAEVKAAEAKKSTEQAAANMESGLNSYFKDVQKNTNTANVAGSETISSEVGGEFVRRALIAVLLACIGIMVYLAFRFEWIFGAGAVIALFHDVVIVFGLLQLFNQEISLDVVAALLTVIGYSVNDTIVIFDRIRETLRTTYGMQYKDILNTSINQSLNRTTITVLTTLFTTVVMLIFGGPGLRPFALALTLGIIKGTYSSSFVATPLLYEYHEWRRRRLGAGATQPATAR